MKVEKRFPILLASLERGVGFRLANKSILIPGGIFQLTSSIILDSADSGPESPETVFDGMDGDSVTTGSIFDAMVLDLCRLKTTQFAGILRHRKRTRREIHFPAGNNGESQLKSRKKAIVPEVPCGDFTAVYLV